MEGSHYGGVAGIEPLTSLDLGQLSFAVMSSNHVVKSNFLLCVEDLQLKKLFTLKRGAFNYQQYQSCGIP